MKFLFNSLKFLVIINLLYCFQDILKRNLKLIESSQDYSVIIFKLVKIDGKYLVNIGIGSQNQNVSLIVDTAAMKSLVYANRQNVDDNSQLKVYDKNLSQSYSSNLKTSKIEKIYFYTNNEMIANNLKGIVSYEKISMSSDINHIKFEISNLEFLLNEDDSSETKSDGIFALTRAANIKISEDDSLSLLKKVSLNYKLKEFFMLIMNKDIDSNSYLVFGDFTKLSQNEYFKNYNLNFNLTDTNVISSCDIIQNNIRLTDLWSCSLSEINLSAKDKNITLKMANNYFTIDTTIHETLIPENAQVIVDQKIGTVRLIDFILNELSSNCTIKESDFNRTSKIKNANNSFMKYKYIQCPEKPKDLNKFSFLLSGKEHNITITFLEQEELNQNGNKEVSYKLREILFYKISDVIARETNYTSIWVLGNNYLNNFQAVGFDEESKKIIFYSYSTNPIHIDEEESLFSFFLLSLFCVILLIVIVFLVPYILYRRRRKAMMEKLQYEIIYKKMNDITREYGK